MKQGCGAGNPLADLLFSIGFGKVVKRLRRGLEAAGLTITLVATGARDFIGLHRDTDGARDVARLNDFSYADDVPFLIAKQASLLIDAITLAGQIMWAVYEECGLRLNWGETKTAVAIRWTGEQGRESRRYLEQSLGDRIMLKRGDRTAPLHIVAKYKHVIIES